MSMPKAARWFGALACAAACAVGALVAQEPAKSQKGIEVERALAARFDSGRKWAVVIGVNEYLDPTIPRLHFCVSDARLIAESLTKRCGYDASRILLITDDQDKAHLRPLKMNLQKQIAGWLKNAVRGDTVLVFFSGHGILDDRGQGFLVPQDCEKEQLGLTAFRTEELRDMLHQCKATQKILILDCCHAGGSRSLEVGPSSQEIGQAFQQAEGLITLASCRKKELSQEWKAKHQGLFTYFLIQGLEGAADFDRNGLVDSDEIYRYTVDHVPTTAQRELNVLQTPVRIIGEDVVGVFALARVSVPGVVDRPAPPPKPELATNSLGMKFVLIPAGEFEMGSPAAEIAALTVQTTRPGEQNALLRSEGPRHRVRITRPFYLGAHEVTVGQFRQFAAEAGHRTDPERDGKGGIGIDATRGDFTQAPSFTWRAPGFAQDDDHPVVQVSWEDARQFCQWLSRKEGLAYRLPTEAEWEYACRAGTKTRYWCGDDAERLVEAANLVDAAARARFPHWQPALAGRDGYVFTAPVGRFKANPFGLYDMHGNASEWCADWYGGDYYAASPSDDPLGPASGDQRVVRGGAWNSVPQYVRSADRSTCPPNLASCTVGFRVAWTP